MLNKTDSPEMVNKTTIFDSNNDVWYKSYHYEIGEFFIINLVHSTIDTFFNK